MTLQPIGAQRDPLDAFQSRLILVCERPIIRQEEPHLLIVFGYERRGIGIENVQSHIFAPPFRNRLGHATTCMPQPMMQFNQLSNGGDRFLQALAHLSCQRPLIGMNAPQGTTLEPDASNGTGASKQVKGNI